MLTLSSAKVQMDNLNLKYNSALGKIAGQQEVVSALGERIQDLEAHDQEQEEVNQELERKDKELKAELGSLNSPVTILTAEESNGLPNCAKVCSGTTGRQSTSWVDYSTNGVYVDVDISGCGFVKIPTLTTSIEGHSSHWRVTGSSSVYDTTVTGFRIYIEQTVLRKGLAASRLYNVEWIAIGFTC